MDALSELLGAIRLESALFLSARFSAPWCVDTPTGADACRTLMPGAQQIIPFHLVTQGHCLVFVDDHPPVEVHQGQAVLFPQGTPHRLGSHKGLAARDISTLLPSTRANAPLMQISHGGGGDICTMRCGFLACQPLTATPLLSALPSVLTVSISAPTAARTNLPSQLARVSSLIGTLFDEGTNDAPGAAAAQAKLAELLFIEAVRAHVAQSPGDVADWIAGLQDPIVVRTLSALHQHPEQAWTLDSLARSVGSSRSVISERFSRHLKMPPMQYLGQLRMRIAAQLLQAPGHQVETVSQAVGFSSQAAFSRAFKRATGVAPSRWK